MSLEALESELYDLINSSDSIGLLWTQMCNDKEEKKSARMKSLSGARFYHKIKRGSKIDLCAVISKNKDATKKDAAKPASAVDLQFPIELEKPVSSCFIKSASAINSHTISMQVHRHLLMLKHLKSVLTSAEKSCFMSNSISRKHFDDLKISIMKNRDSKCQDESNADSNQERINALVFSLENIGKSLGLQTSTGTFGDDAKITSEFSNSILLKCKRNQLCGSNSSCSGELSLLESNDTVTNDNIIEKEIPELKKATAQDLSLKVSCGLSDEYDIQVYSEGEPTKDLKNAMVIINSIDKTVAAKQYIQIVEASQRYSTLKKVALVKALEEKITYKCCFSQDVSMFVDKKKVRNPLYSKLLRARTNELIKSYKIKYGRQVEGWTQLISSVAKQSLTFDLLSRSPTNQITFTETGCMGSQDITSCESIFVLYNYARLCKIIDHYNEQVAQGVYPQFPDINSIDFSLLKTEDEWHIFVEFLLTYPRILDSIMESLISDSSSTSFDPLCSKICRYLIEMSRAISSYYHQTKVLLNPASHQLPLIFARLGFVKALIKAYDHAFQLLGIEPPKQM